MLDGELFGSELLTHQLVHDDRITSSSFIENYSSSEARMSRNGWCTESVCDGVEDNQYIQVDFGAEIVVEGIAIDHVGGVYVTEYYVEYGSDVNELHCVISEESNGSVSC